MMKKRTIRTLAASLAVLMFAFCLAGCGKTETEQKPAAGDSSTADGKTYVIYSDNSFAPFEYYDSDSGVYVGVDMDLLKAIADDQKFQYEMRNEGFDASMGAVQSGQADGMIAGMSITDERKETYDFSDGYFKNGQIMVVKKGGDVKTLDDLKGTVVAAKTSTQGATYAKSIADQYGFTIQYYEDSPTMYTAVVNGINSCCFEDHAVINWAIQSEKLELETVGDDINPCDYGFAVKKGTNADLIEKFNAGLANIKANGKYDEIMAKYGC